MSRPTWDPGWAGGGFAEGALTRYGAPFQALPLAAPAPWRRSRNPRGQAPGFGLGPLSLAATDGIDLSFFSSGY